MDNARPHHPSRLPEDLRTWARDLRTRMTDAELLLWHLLRNRRIANTKFRRQHPLGRYILDFYCEEKKLCIELDGSQHAEAKDYDASRTEWLHAQGIQVLRFWNNQMLSETEAVMETIYSAIVTPPTPDLLPSPASGRGAGGEGL